MSKSEKVSRADYEQAVGAVVLALNELGTMLVNLMACFYGSDEQAMATAGAVNFKGQIDILKALNAVSKLPEEQKTKVSSYLTEAKALADARNSVAHADLFTFFYDDDDGEPRHGHQLQSRRRDKTGRFKLNTVDVTVEDLRKSVKQANELSQKVWDVIGYHRVQIDDVFGMRIGDK